jgi:hypothetical protein
MSKTEEVAALWSKAIWCIVQELRPASLRDQFAMAALKGIIGAVSLSGLNQGWTKTYKEAWTMEAYEFADAMLKAREE